MAYINNRFLKGTTWFITHTGLFKKRLHGLDCTITKYYPRRYRGQVDPDRVFRVHVGNVYVGQRKKFRDAIALANFKACPTIPKLTKGAKKILNSGWPKLSTYGIESIFRKCKENRETIINSKAVLKAMKQLQI